MRERGEKLKILISNQRFSVFLILYFFTLRTKNFEGERGNRNRNVNLGRPYLVIQNLIVYFCVFQLIEEEAQKRIELLVKKRVEEELEKRKDEIELEVAKRVEAAKRQMEAEMMLELERRKAQALEEQRKREVHLNFFLFYEPLRKYRACGS